MSLMFLSTFCGQVTPYAAAAERAGYWFRTNCGEPNIWCLSPGRGAGPAAMWEIPWTGARYAFVFQCYGAEPLKQQPFLGLLEKLLPEGEVSRLIQVTDCVYVLPTGVPIPGYDVAAESWSAVEEWDDIECLVQVIDTETPEALETFEEKYSRVLRVFDEDAKRSVPNLRVLYGDND